MKCCQTKPEIAASRTLRSRSVSEQPAFTMQARGCSQEAAHGQRGHNGHLARKPQLTVAHVFGRQQELLPALTAADVDKLCFVKLQRCATKYRGLLSSTANTGGSALILQTNCSRIKASRRCSTETDSYTASGWQILITKLHTLYCCICVHQWRINIGRLWSQGGHTGHGERGAKPEARYIDSLQLSNAFLCRFVAESVLHLAHRPPPSSSTKKILRTCANPIIQHGRGRRGTCPVPTHAWLRYSTAYSGET